MRRPTHFLATAILLIIPSIAIAHAGSVSSTGHVSRVEMHTNRHFINHRYSAFNEPVTIEPSKGAGG